jgi:hypothetical protein
MKLEATVALITALFCAEFKDMLYGLVPLAGGRFLQGRRSGLLLSWQGEIPMTTKLAFNLIAVSCLAIAPAFAQSSNAQEEDKSAKTRSVTGCLSAGDSANEFKLTQDDGSTWEIQSKGVKLSPHVGHTVTVTGKVWHPDMHGAKEKTKEAVDPNAKEHGHLSATSVSMVSESCKK